MMHTLAGLNIILGLVGFSWLVVRTMQRFHEYPREVLNLLLMAMAFFFALLVTSADMYYRHFDSYTALAISVVKVFALYILWKHPATLFRTGKRTGHKSDSANSERDTL